MGTTGDRSNGPNQAVELEGCTNLDGLSRPFCQMVGYADQSGVKPGSSGITAGTGPGRATARRTSRAACAAAVTESIKGCQAKARSAASREPEVAASMVDRSTAFTAQTRPAWWSVSWDTVSGSAPLASTVQGISITASSSRWCSTPGCARSGSGTARSLWAIARISDSATCSYPPAARSRSSRSPASGDLAALDHVRRLTLGPRLLPQLERLVRMLGRLGVERGLLLAAGTCRASAAHPVRRPASRGRSSSSAGTRSGSRPSDRSQSEPNSRPSSKEVSASASTAAARGSRSTPPDRRPRSQPRWLSPRSRSNAVAGSTPSARATHGGRGPTGESQMPITRSPR